MTFCLVEYSTCSLYFNMCFFDVSASLYPLLLLVICRMHSVREYHCISLFDYSLTGEKRRRLLCYLYIT